MTVEVNGELRELRGGASLAEALGGIGVAPDQSGVAAAVDGEVVRREEWRSLELHEGQSIEVVKAVQGG